MKNAAERTKKFVSRNKNTIVAVALLGTVIAIQTSGIKSLNAFLDEHGLLNEYYHNGEV